MNEFTGAVLKGQLQKLETICTRLRTKARKVRQAIADLPDIKLRKSADPDGDLGVGVFLVFETKRRRDLVYARDGGRGSAGRAPAGSVILPADSRIAKKATTHGDWPSFQSPQGKAIRYGREACPKTIDILGRSGGVIIDPSYSDQDVEHIIRAIRKVYPAVRTA